MKENRPAYLNKELSEEASFFKIPETLSKGIIRYLEKEIIEGRLKPGTRLIPEELSSQLNVSKSPIREALVHLERDGLVTNKPRIGFFVTDIKLEDIEEIYPIRAALIALALKTIIENGYESGFVQTLEETLQEMEKRVREDDIKGYFYLNVQFHTFLLNHCPNRRVDRILDLLGKQVLRFRFLAMSTLGHIKLSLEGHKRLLAALKEKDTVACMRIAENIIYKALNVLQGVLNEKNVATNREY